MGSIRRFVSRWPRDHRWWNLFWLLLVAHVLASYLTIGLFAVLMMQPNMYQIGVSATTVALAPAYIFMYLAFGLFVLMNVLVMGPLAFIEGGAWGPLMLLSYLTIFLIARLILKHLRVD